MRAEHAHELGGELRVPLARRGLAAQGLQRGVMRERGGPVRAMRGERVVGVDDREQAYLERDLLAAQRVGVAAAVVALVMVADHLQYAAERHQGAHHLLADDGMIDDAQELAPVVGVLGLWSGAAATEFFRSRRGGRGRGGGRKTKKFGVPEALLNKQ